VIPVIASWHSFIVHFAVAFTLASAIMDAIDFLRRGSFFERTSFILSILALPFLIGAALTGNLASQFVTQPYARAVLEMHETYANIAVWVFSAAAFWRIFHHLRRNFLGIRKIVYVFVVMAAAMSIFLAARKGGAIRHQPYKPVAFLCSASPALNSVDGASTTTGAAGSIRPSHPDL
jgi:uncharacterized membrane protein